MKITMKNIARFKTKLTDLLGISHPVLCGGLMWLADAKYVGAVVNAGGMGFITPRSFSGLDTFRTALKDCRKITEGKDFGVNLYISSRPHENDKLPGFIETALEEGVRIFETAGASPKAYLDILKKSESKILHKVTAIKHALKAQEIGVDAVILVGAECGGHPGENLIPSFVLGAKARQHLNIPMIIGGGIGTGEQLLAAIAQGADGILMGSRMLVSKEIWAHRDYKEHLIKLDENNTSSVLSTFGNIYHCLDNDTAKAVAELELSGEADFEKYRHFVQGTLQKQAYETGDYNKGLLSMGPAITFANSIELAGKIIEDIVEDAYGAYLQLSENVIHLDQRSTRIKQDEKNAF